ncbi:MAG: helix-turn-helix domain-containing protein, partial [Pseudomonadota bacterium]
MGKTLSLDLRERVVGALEDVASCRAAAERFGVAASTAIRWVRRWRERGTLVAGTRGGNRRSHRIDAHREMILALIEEEPDLTLIEIGERYLVGLPLSEVQIGTLLAEIVTGATRHQVRMPTDFTMMFKAILTTEGM